MDFASDGTGGVGTQHVCSLCNIDFTSEYHLLKHLVSHKQCPRCQKQFAGPKSGSSYKSHLQHCRGVKVPQPCPHCDMVYKTPFTLNKHLQSVHGIFVPVADIKRDPVDDDVKHEYDNKSDEEFQDDVSYPCDLCGISLVSSKAFVMHLKGHQNNCEDDEVSSASTKGHCKEFKCVICDFTCTTPFKFSIHVKNHKGKLESNGGYSKEEVKIGKGIVTLTTPSTNDKSVDDKKCSSVEFSCRICAKVFSRSSSCQNHESSHRKCELCDKEFSGHRSKQVLKGHLKSCQQPNKKGPHKCTRCSSVFPHYSRLARHNEKSYCGNPKPRCIPCKMQFKTRKGFKMHKCPYNILI